MSLSEERIFELHRELAGKLIEEARAIRARAREDKRIRREG
jgi:cell division septum initiation protein DivIVA